MTIWIDIATAAQVLFMAPIAAELRTRGYEVMITSREFAETTALADRHGLEHTVLGKHGGESLAGKSVAIGIRALRLLWFLRAQKISLAVSHSSYSQALAAGLVRIPFVALNDYEGHPGMRIVCRVARRILVPQSFDPRRLAPYGAANGQVETYNGLKEHVYLSTFEPDPRFLAKMGVLPDKVVVTMRPASDISAYHQFENPLFREILESISEHPEAFIVLLPRTSRQREEYGDLRASNVLIPDRVLDGPNLIHHSDLVIGAGGTMNREATVLGTPVYTIFKGELGSVDQHLIESGKMVRVETASDIPKIRIIKKRRDGTLPRERQALVGELVDRILAE
jgi:hypothetical protein